MGVKLRENGKESGVRSLFLDITTNGKRYKEYLGLTLEPPKSTEIRQKNKQTKLLAESIRAKRELELQAQDYEFTPAFKKGVDFVAYFEKFVADYPHKDLRIVKYSKIWFVKYLESQNITTLKPKQLDERICKGYLEFMQKGLNGETPYNYFSKFKRVVSQARKDKLLFENPTEGIRVARDEGLKKEILSYKEIEQLAGAECANREVKRAFLFSLFSGLRWCDVSVLTYKNIDFANNVLTFSQSKTKHSSKNAIVRMAISPMLLKLIGEQKEQQDIIFNLPTHTGALKILKQWVARSGIKKNITWHCARHSFAVNLLGEVKADVKTVASLLGHSGLKHVEVYTRAVDEKKMQAVNGLPEVEF
ncbi:site-specific integrase [Williamwhitmania taraxaci]|uniref:Site-specific recombinase XerD n=1 Tax=Williamwhitmania taraxaci TaxID=1640674 RepID=A0A1G6GG23_9BACT|nr:site-specific integrase [Williamwhitmania taraxaci]SDB80958.1 Site-specific recombinase XerD [Williamwhitmania taraxaci]